MSIIEVRGVTHRYGVHTALSDLDLSVPSGSLYALLGPNGAGKSTLLQILAGLRRPTEGEVTVLGKDVRDLNAWDRVSIGYVAENQRLPSWMTLRQLESFLAPLYPTWDHALAQKLRTRFRLELHRTIGTLSKGERMKVALYSSLAPRPKLLLMDEPFSGVDVSVKDELVRGLLESAGSEGWTIVVSSHDIAEIELLADWVGFLDCGRLIVSESMESLQGRFQRVDAVAPEGAMIATGDDWLMVERAGRHISFITQNGAENFSAHSRLGFPAATHVDVRPASLREIFVALASLRQDDSGLLELAR